MVHPRNLTNYYQKLPCLKGLTFSKPSFWVSMLVFGSVVGIKVVVSLETFTIRFLPIRLVAFWWCFLSIPAANEGVMQGIKLSNPAWNPAKLSGFSGGGPMKCKLVPSRNSNINSHGKSLLFLGKYHPKRCVFFFPWRNVSLPECSTNHLVS